MKFALVPSGEAGGGLLAHGQKAGRLRLRKGRRLSQADLDALLAAGIERVMVARLDADDVEEDPAAAVVARAAAGAGVQVGVPHNGRVNLYASARGLLLAEPEMVYRLNSAGEAVTVATGAAFAPVEPKQVVATVKVIPLAVNATELERACSNIATPISVAPFRSLEVALVQTVLPGTAPGLLDKAASVTARRLHALECTLLSELRCEHRVSAVADAITGLRARGVHLILIIGASATVDRRDVVPSAVERAHGEVLRLGMPVDPGNLLLLARVDSTPILGLPGSARSPRLSGYDLVLRRLAAGLEVSADTIARLGAGGLLKEIAERPSPRTAEAAPAAPRRWQVAAVVLAAGQSRRMGARNKLLIEVGGAPMVVKAADAALASRASAVYVVTGFEHERVVQALQGKAVCLVHNPEFAAGLSTSLVRGLGALPPRFEGALVCLADMPTLASAVLDRLIEAFDPGRGQLICVPTFAGKRGNPVLWGRRFFAEMQEVKGDVGARHLIGEYEALVCEVPMDDAAVLRDVDSPDELARLASELGGPS